MYQEVPVLKQHKLYLADFWLQFGGVGARYLRAMLPKEVVIKELIRMGRIDLHYRSPTHTRQDWDKKKRKVKKYLKFKCCFACGDRASDRHHIIWLSHGGRNQKNNILALCRPCHAEIHPWLKVNIDLV